MRWALAAAAVLVACVIAVPGADRASGDAEAPPTTLPVQRGKLSALVSLDGVLTYRARMDGSPFAAINRAAGTYTALPDAGAAFDCGDVLYRVDEDPVVLLCGPVPAYRDLEPGDSGTDVRQLNRTLNRLGGDVAADETRFTAQTEAALTELGLDVDDAIFLPGSVRIARVTGRLGAAARPGAAVALATRDTIEVQVQLDAAQQREVRAGDRARITLPGNRTATGRVARIGRVARAPAGQGVTAATLPAFIALDRPQAARGLDRAPVQVDVTTKGVEDALSVPVTALVGKSGGGYAVEVVRNDGARALVAVDLGLFDTTAGRVEVVGALEEGDDVVVPSP